MTSAIVPRPIAFVSTISKSGHENLAPFRYAGWMIILLIDANEIHSWFNMVSHSPPLVSISVRISDSGEHVKDTADNIRSTREFTVSMISEPWANNANMCGIDAPPEVDEWLVSGLTKVPSVSSVV